MGGQPAESAFPGDADLAVTACMHHTVAPGYGIADRVWDQHICNLIVDGAVAVVAGGRRRTIAAGGALWIGPGVRHSFALPDPARPFAMLNLRFVLRRRGRSVPLPQGALLVDDAWDLRPLWEMAIDDGQRRRPDRIPRLRHLLALLHGDLAERDAGDAATGGLGRRRRLALVDWAAAHLHARPTPADLARVVGLSPDWFRRAFARSFGMSPRAWLTRERVRRAAQRLSDDPRLRVAALARELGYDDHRLLDRQFRAVMGVSPGRWRRG